MLGIAEFEKRNRSLCRKAFSGEVLKGMESLEHSLSEEEREMLLYYLTSGAYGTVERGIENRVKQYRKRGLKMSKLRYAWDRLFPGYDTYKFYAPNVKGRFLQSVVGWFRRMFIVTVTKKRRQPVVKEVKTVSKIK